LAAARLEAGAVALVDLDLGRVASETVEEARAMGAGRGVDLVPAIEGEAPVRGDATALARAAANLADNALKAAPPGTTVRVGAGRDGSWAWLAVEDRGPGVDPLSISDTGGLGLSIVRRIAEAHRGRLSVFSSEEAGSTFVVWIPAKGVDPGFGSPPDSCPLADPLARF
ncbi:MAG: sensor histidine kinase, partial [Acidimicrobiia bacterium]